MCDDDSASDISLNDLISENESGLEDETESEANVLKLDVVESVSVGDYVVVEFAKNFSKCYYVGRVTKERDEEDDVEVQFLRKKKGQCLSSPLCLICRLSMSTTSKLFCLSLVSVEQLQEQRESSFLMSILVPSISISQEK